MTCPNCHATVDADATFCPSCGYKITSPAYTTSPTAPSRYPVNTLCVVALVAAFLCWPLGFILGFVARSNLPADDSSNRALSLAAIIISAVFGIIIIVALVALGSLFGQVAHQLSNCGPRPSFLQGSGHWICANGSWISQTS
jgi:hypothetical protein